MKITLLKSTTNTSNKLSLKRVSGISSGLTLKRGNTLFFTLTQAATTSVGVFRTSDDVQVRTLSSNVRREAGTYVVSWDKKDDWGQQVASGEYYILVLANNLQVTWNAAVGNNSSATTGPTVHRGYDRMWDMVRVGNYMYYVREYAEGNPSVAKFLITDNKKKVNVTPLMFISIGQATDNICSDGTNIYMSGRDPFSDGNATWFIFAIKASDESQVSFSSGQPYSNVSAYNSVINLQTNMNNRITGLAVNSNYLFCSHQLLNQVRVINKTTGAIVQTNTVTAPRKLAVIGNSLYVCSESSVLKYTVNSDGTFSAPTSIGGFTYPLALGASPNGASLLVADGKESQQLKLVNPSTNQVEWVYGQMGGYLTNATVSTDKFYFSDRRGIDKPTNFIQIAKGTDSTFVRFETDTEFWVGDSGNNRVLKFNLSRTLLDEITYQPHMFSASIDRSNKNRVFSNFLEWQIDYTKPFRTSWKLVRNWGGSILPSDHYIDSGGFDSVATLSNGRTYGLVRNDSVPSSQTRMFYELMVDGTLRKTGVSIPVNPREEFYPDGSLRTFVNPNGYPGSTPGVVEFRRRNLTGFDSNNNPQWGSWITEEAVPNSTKRDPMMWYAKGTEIPGQITEKGIQISFDAATPFTGDLAYVHNSEGYHIGGAKNGKWVWRTAKATGAGYSGPYPSNGDFDTGNGVLNAGSAAVTIGNVVAWGYHGEFYKGSAQVNKWNLLDGDTGLMLTQFGVTTKDFPDHSEAPAQMAGNSFCPMFVKISNDKLGLWHNDESYHGGLHLWVIEGISTINRIKLAAI